MGNDTGTSAPAEFIASCEIVDLSVMIGDDYPCYWPTIMGYHASVFHRIGEWMGPFFTRYMIMEEHVGTHCDAPAHFIPTPETASHTPPNTADDRRAGPSVSVHRTGVVVDCRSLRGKAKLGECPIISVDLLKEWEKKNGPFVRATLYSCAPTGPTTHIAECPRASFGHAPILEKSAPGWPSPDYDAMAYLAEAGVRSSDTTATASGPCRTTVAPLAGLGAGMVFVERLTRLGELPTRGALFVFLPIKCEGRAVRLGGDGLSSADAVGEPVVAHTSQAQLALLGDAGPHPAAPHSQRRQRAFGRGRGPRPGHRGTAVRPLESHDRRPGHPA